MVFRNPVTNESAQAAKTFPLLEVRNFAVRSAWARGKISVLNVRLGEKKKPR